MSATAPLPQAEAPAAPPEPKCLIPLNVAPDAPVLFCPHAIDGGPLIYRELVALLTPAFQVYGFECRSLLFDCKPFASVEDMARHYVRELRAVQPQGPYRLFGFSSGGLVALEIAQQLRTLGEDVPLLVLADTYTTWMSSRELNERFDWCLFAEALVAKELSDSFYRDRDSVHPFWSLSYDDKLRFFAEHRPAARPPADAVEQLRRQHEAFLRYVLTYQRYQPRPYDGPATLLTANATPALLEHALRRLCLANVTVASTDVRSHLQLVFKPGVVKTAELLVQMVTSMRDPVEQKVVSIWEQILGVETCDASASFYALGGTSIMAEQIASRVEAELSVPVTGIEVLRYHELGDFVRTVRAKLAS
jgi:thioesterase domain-containing protein